MLTPIEIQGKVFKSGVGYDKKDVDIFVSDMVKNYEQLYKDNRDLNEKLNVLSEGVQYYKNIEKTLQKALVVAQKASEDIENTAQEKAKEIEEEARAQAKAIVYEAQKDLDRIQMDCKGLVQEYEKMKMQFKEILENQMEMVESDSFHLDVDTIKSYDFYNKDSKSNDDYLDMKYSSGNNGGNGQNGWSQDNSQDDEADTAATNLILESLQKKASIMDQQFSNNNNPIMNENKGMDSSGMYGNQGGQVSYGGGYGQSGQYSNGGYAPDVKGNNQDMMYNYGNGNGSQPMGNGAKADEFDKLIKEGIKSYSPDSGHGIDEDEDGFQFLDLED